MSARTSTRAQPTGDAMAIRYPKGDGILGGGNWHMRCGKSHRTISAVAKCCWPKARFQGDGEYAVVSNCKNHSVALSSGLDDARRALLMLDTTGCGRECTWDHQILVLRLEDPDNGLWRSPAHP